MRIAPELLVILAGVLLLGAGLVGWFGWAVACTVLGVLLVAAGVSSAASAGRRERGR